MQKCLICMEKLAPPRAPVRIVRGDACGHPYCLSCLRTYFHYKVEDGVYHIRCPAEGCSFRYSESDCRKILGPSMLIVEDQATRKKCQQTWERLKEFMRRKHNGHLVAVLRHAMQMAAASAASSTSNSTALDAATPAASSSVSAASSPLNQAAPVDEQCTDDGSQHFGAWALQSCQACPSCNVIVRKEEGCDHISCTCGSDFCYGCGAPMDGAGVRSNCLCNQTTRKSQMRLGLWLRKWKQINLEEEPASADVDRAEPPSHESVEAAA